MKWRSWVRRFLLINLCMAFVTLFLPGQALAQGRDDGPTTAELALSTNRL